MKVGQVTSVKRVFDQDDFDRFAALSGDDNPIHVDPAFAARTGFGRTVAHGMLLYSAVCAVLGERLPGPGAVQLEQELMFPSATYADEEITIQLEVTELRQSERLAELSTVVTRPDGSVGLQGKTLVRLPGETPFQKPPPQTPMPPDPQTFKGLEIGQTARILRSFTSQDLAEYADLSGDVNPIFTDAAYARRLGLAGPMIPGGLLGGLFSYLLGTRLPGRGTHYLKQRIEFLAPAYPGQELGAIVDIIRLRPEKQLVNLSTLCTNPAGETVCRGEALVLVKDVKRKT